MDEYKVKYKRILLARKLCLIPLITSFVLYVMSIYLNERIDMRMIRHIRDFSFGNLFVTVAGFIYIILFAKDLKVSYELCKVEPSNFLANVKYASFGIALMAIMFLISIIWIITMLVLVY